MTSEPPIDAPHSFQMKRGKVARFPNGRPSDLEFVQSVADAIAKPLVAKNRDFRCSGLVDATNAAITVIEDYLCKLSTANPTPDTSLVAKLERLYFPDDASIAAQSVADNNMAIVKAIAIVRQHQAAQPQDVVFALRSLLDATANTSYPDDHPIWIARKGAIAVMGGVLEAPSSEGCPLSPANYAGVVDGHHAEKSEDSVRVGDPAPDHSEISGNETMAQRLDKVMASDTFGSLSLENQLRIEATAAFLRITEPVSVSLEKVRFDTQQEFADYYMESGTQNDVIKAVLDAAGVKYHG
jgi:hypothetical protein